MRRLTISGTGEAKSDVVIQDVLNKLKYYEDLEEKLEEVYGECPELLETIINVLVKHEGFNLGNQVKSKLLTDESIDQWESWKKADKDGRLIELPVAIGECVYVIYTGVNGKNPVIMKRRFDYGMIPMFGKAVFKTEEDANTVLKKMEG